VVYVWSTEKCREEKSRLFHGGWLPGFRAKKATSTYLSIENFVCRLLSQVFNDGNGIPHVELFSAIISRLFPFGAAEKSGTSVLKKDL
jgi:hypothetical protein